MIIRFTCPKCQKKHTVSEDLAGKAVACPCGQKLKLPSTSGNVEASPDHTAEQSGEPPQGNMPGGGWDPAAQGDPSQGYQQYPQGYDPSGQGGWYGGDYGASYGYDAGQGGSQEYYGNYPQQGYDPQGGYGPYGAPSQPSYDPSAGFNPYAGYEQYGQGQYGGYGHGYGAPGGYQNPSGYGGAPGYGGTPGYGAAPGYGGMPPQPGPGEAPATPPASPGAVTVQLQVSRRMLFGGVALLVLAFGIGGYLAMRPAPNDEQLQAKEEQGNPAPQRQQAEEEAKQQQEQQPPTEPQHPSTQPDTPAADSPTQPMPPTQTPMQPTAPMLTPAPAASTPSAPRTPSPTPAQPAAGPSPPAAAVAADDDEPRHELLGPRVQVGPYSFNPPDVTVCVTRRARESGDKTDSVFYGCGPGITGRPTGKDPIYKFRVQVEYRAVADRLNYLHSVVAGLSTLSRLSVFRQPAEAPQTESINGLEFTGHYFTSQFSAIERSGLVFICTAPDHVLTVIGYCEDRQSTGWCDAVKPVLQSFKRGDISTGPPALTAAERKRLEARTVPQESDQPINWGSRQKQFREADLRPDPELLAQLGPEERFGNFVLRRPTNLSLQKIEQVIADYLWVYTRPGTDRQRFSLGIYLFNRPRVSFSTMVLDTMHITLARHQFGELDALRNPSLFETGSPNGLPLYTRSGTVNGQDGPSTLFYYVAKHRNHTIVVIGIAKDPADLQLLDTVGRTLRTVKPGEALPLAKHSTVPPERRGTPDIGPFWDETPQELAPDRQQMDLLGPEVRIGTFALRFPNSMTPVAMPMSKLNDTWVLAEYDDTHPLITQHTMCVYLQHRPFPAGINYAVMGEATQHIDSATVNWLNDPTGFTTLNGERVHYMVGTLPSVDFRTRSGEAMGVSCLHEGYLITVVITCPDKDKSPETYKMLQAAMLSLRVAKPEEALPTPPTSFELEAVTQ